jgi:hypothetical protein
MYVDNKVRYEAHLLVAGAASAVEPQVPMRLTNDSRI